MKNMTLPEIAKACNGQLFGYVGNQVTEAAGVVIDSRQVGKNYLFIATVGERVDGHNFIDDVFDKGALAVVCEKVPSSPKGPYILVSDSFLALKDLATWYRMQLDVKVVGITGSVGKTSTKEFISSVLSQKYKVLKTKGNFNNEVGMPLTILKIQQDHEVAVLEMGISDFGEMHRLSEIAKPDIAVITNIGLCHLENLKSRQGIFKAKTEIFDFMNENGRVCVNGDDDLLASLGEVHGQKPITFGIHQTNDIYASKVESLGLFGSTCELHVQDQVLSARIPLPGEHMVLNAAAAASVGILLSLTGTEIAAGIEAVQPVDGRSNIIRAEKWTIIDDCYNANPVSMKAAIDLLTVAGTNKVAILGDMGELGANEAALHKELGSYAATKNLDVIVCVGILSSNIYDGASDKFNGKLLYFSSREELISSLPSIVKKNDTILVKASHFMGFENVVQALLP
ncbi:MAG: UDP-N-acetylmuramoyl-tripeptide--D-alanyl-D-alanine ligase [Mobilitalea sp.]